MRIIARRTVVVYGNRHPATRAALSHWVTIVSTATWRNTAEVLNGERIRFEVAGGDFRLIAAFDFGRGIAFVKFIGTHAEYDRIDALTVSQF